MADEAVILGTEDSNKGVPDSIRLTTSHGDVFVIRNSDIVRREAAEVGGTLQRLVLAPDALVFLEVQSEKLIGADAMNGTILKYYDDGSTISKSRDDG